MPIDTPPSGSHGENPSRLISGGRDFLYADVADLTKYRLNLPDGGEKTTIMQRINLQHMRNDVSSSSASIEKEVQLPAPESSVSPRELSAELKAIEERIERRHDEVLHRIDRLGDTFVNSSERTSADIARLKQDLDGNYRKLDGRFDDMAKDNRSTRATVWVTVIAAFFAAVGLIYASNSNIIASFDVGRSAPISKDQTP